MYRTKRHGGDFSCAPTLCKFNINLETLCIINHIALMAFQDLANNWLWDANRIEMLLFSSGDCCLTNMTYGIYRLVVRENWRSVVLKRLKIWQIYTLMRLVMTSYALVFFYLTDTQNIWVVKLWYLCLFIWKCFVLFWLLIWTEKKLKRSFRMFFNIGP